MHAETPHQEQYYIVTNHNNGFYVAGIIWYDARGEMAGLTERYFIDHKSIDAKINKARISYRFLLRNMEKNEKKELPSAKHSLRPMKGQVGARVSLPASPGGEHRALMRRQDCQCLTGPTSNLPFHL